MVWENLSRLLSTHVHVLLCMHMENFSFVLKQKETQNFLSNLGMGEHFWIHAPLVQVVVNFDIYPLPSLINPYIFLYLQHSYGGWAF